MSHETSFYERLKESFLLLDFGDRTLFEQHGLSVSRYYALHHVACQPGLLPSQLSQLMFCDKSNITRLLQSLTRDGLIARQPHEYDGRAQRLYLTAEGQRRYECVAAAHERSIRRRLAALDALERAAIDKALSRLNESLARELTKDVEENGM